jgi:alpha-beta hydrolase superfamily lysophospholipase
MSTTSYTTEVFRSSDGYAWRYRRYPAGSPRGHVVFLHGIQSHAGWYDFSCTRISQAGFAVSFLDRRGSGLNEQDRGDAPSFRRLLGDIIEFLESQTIKPVCLAGISWGGKLAVALQRYRPGLVDGLALVCPGLFPKVRPTLRERVGIGWSRLVAPGRQFLIPLNDPELFTASPKWQEFIRSDPLSLHHATARLLIESLRLDVYLRLVPRHVQAPVLLMLAEHDRIIDNARTKSYVESFASADRQVIEYPGAHHTLEFEPEPDKYVGDLVDWLVRHS